MSTTSVLLAENGNGEAASREYRLVEGITRSFRTYTPSLFPMLKDLVTAAEHNLTILLVGETGTGKTTLARLIHELSSRRNERFLTVPCGSLPNELIDSELFGHVKGSFTGADKTKEGKFDAAQKGTILLDEIDVLGLMQQTKLLRVLETREFEPVGSNETRTANCRTVVASNVCLEKLIAEGRFRPDLYFRLKQVSFDIPPLRKRPNDIVPLAMDIIEECCQEECKPALQIHPEFLDALTAYAWPGNIRELRNEIRRAVILCRCGELTPDCLPRSLLQAAHSAREQGEVVPLGLAGNVAIAEQEAIEQMLEAQNFNRAATARALGISRVTLYNKIRKYRINM